MASGQSMFKGAFGWDDWIWWVTIGCVALLILLLLVCCCVCMQRAKRKGHEEALAAVQARQRLTQERERAEQQRYQQAQPPRDVTFASNNGSVNGYQPAYGYSKQVTTVPLPNRKNLGPQVAANGYQGYPSQHTQQFAKPYPSLPGQQKDQTGQTPGHRKRYEAPSKWYNVEAHETSVPRLSPNNSNYDAPSSQYPDSMRFDDPYPIGGGPDSVPFMSITSPSTVKSLRTNRKDGVRLQNQTAINTETAEIPAPVVVPKYSRAPPSPSETRSSAGLESGASGGTLQSRIDALRSADTNDMVHSRISDPSYLSAKTGGALDTFAMPGTSNAQDSYARGPVRRSGVGSNVMSLNSSAMSSLLFSSPSGSLDSGDSYETLDSRAFESAKLTVLGSVLTHGSSRSIGSDYSHSQFEDTESFGAGGRDCKRQNSGNGYSTTPSRPMRGDNVSFNSRNSVEF